MDNMNNEFTVVCPTCLSKGRKLYPVSAISSILREIMDNAFLLWKIELNIIGLCWECTRILNKFIEFKEKALKAIYILKMFPEIQDYKSLSTLSKANVFSFENETETNNEEQIIYPTHNVIPDVHLTNNVIGQDDHSNNVIGQDDNTNNVKGQDLNLTNNMQEYFTPIIIKMDKSEPLEETLVTIKYDPSENSPTNFDPIDTTGIEVVKEFKIEIEEERPIKAERESINITSKQNLSLPEKEIVLSTIEEVEEHIKKTDQRVKCDCGSILKNEARLRDHRRVYHNKEGQFKCKFCLRLFKTKLRLDSHIVTHDETLSKKMSYCAECNIQFKTIYNYRAHMKVTTAHVKQGYPCPACEKVFLTKSYANRHYQYVHLKQSKYCCNICNKVLFSKSHLIEHKQANHELDRPRNHQCDVCKKKFYTPSFLKRHKMIHSKVRSYLCSQCGDTFKQSAALYNHTKLVHEKKINKSKKKKNN